MTRARLLGVAHPWIDAIGADPDEVRALFAELGAPYPARLADGPLVLAGKKSGVSIHVHAVGGGHQVARISAVAGTAAWPAALVAGEPRAAVRARLGRPATTTASLDSWSLDEGKSLAVTYDADRVTGVEVAFAD